MANVRTLSGMNDNGFDDFRSLLVLSTTKTSTLYLVEGGSDNVTVVIDDPEVASCVEKDETKAHKKDKNFNEWERSQAVHKLTIKGLKAGETTRLRAVLEDGRDFITPVTIRVVDNADYRQAGDKVAITPELRQELQKMDIRSAVLRVAEDQMNSKIGRTVDGGDGRFGLEAGRQWCGAFAYWCWATASDAKGVDNPFGASKSVLLSPQKAISWALQSKRGPSSVIKAEIRTAVPLPRGNRWVRKQRRKRLSISARPTRFALQTSFWSETRQIGGTSRSSGQRRPEMAWIASTVTSNILPFERGRGV